MLSLTEGYLSLCPPPSSLSLSHLSIKNLLARSLLSVWSLWGLHLVPWLGSGFPTNPGGTLILTHLMTTLRTWLARMHPPDFPRSHPTPEILLVSPHTLIGLPLWSLPLVSLGFQHSSFMIISGSQTVEERPLSQSASAWVYFCYFSLRDHPPKILVPGDPQTPQPFVPTSH
jgi:hypothetical protein